MSEDRIARALALFWNRQERTNEVPDEVPIFLQFSVLHEDFDSLEFVGFADSFLNRARLRAVAPSTANRPGGLYVGELSMIPTGKLIRVIYESRGPFDSYERVVARIRREYGAAEECNARELTGTPYGAVRLMRNCNGNYDAFARLVGNTHRAWLGI